MNDKRYFLLFSLVVGVVLGTAALVSYIGDPGEAFSRNIHEKEVAAILLGGENVCNFDDCDGRLIQKNLIQTDTRQVNAIVLGSSRSMQIRNSSLVDPAVDRQIFLNHGVPGASLEDYIAILDLYLERGYIPRTIIIGVDPWILNANNDQKRWRTLEEEYYDGLARINSTLIVSDQYSMDIGYYIDRYSSLIARQILFNSINKIISGPCHATDADEADGYIKLTDGSISYPVDIRTRTVEQVDAEANDYAHSVPIFALGNFDQIDEESRQEFEATIQFLKSRNTTVVLFLPPYHPIVYDKIASEAQYSTVGVSESYFREFASAENITLVGSYDPNYLNLSSIDFYDGHHLKRDVVDSVFRATVVERDRDAFHSTATPVPERIEEVPDLLT